MLKRWPFFILLLHFIKVDASLIDDINYYKNIGLEHHQISDSLQEKIIHISRANPDSALLLCEIIKEFADNANNKTTLGTYHKTKAQIYQRLRDFDQAMSEAKTAFRIFTHLNDSNGLAGTALNIGNSYNHTGNIVQAMVYYNQSIDIYRKIDKSDKIPGIYINIANSYYMLRDGYNSIHFYQKAINELQYTPEIQFIDIAYLNLSSAFLELQNNPDSALFYVSIAEKLRVKKGFTNGLINCYSVKSNAFILLNDMDSAFHYLNLAKDIVSKTKAKKNLNIDYSEALYLFKIQSDTTMNIVLEGIKNSIKRDNYDMLLQFYKLAFETSEHNKRFDLAYQFSTKYHHLSDSLINQTNYQKLTQQRFQEEFNKTELIRNQKAEADNIKRTAERKRIFIILFFSLILLLFFGYSFWSIRKRYKIIKKQKRIIQKQKITTDEQFEELQIKNTQITDSMEYAERIQNSMLPDFNAFFKDQFILYLPKDHISGDFYWAHSSNNYTWACLADCTGHGVPGALMSIMGMQLLDQFVRPNSEILPHEVLNKMDKAIKSKLGDKTGETNDGMDIVLLKINHNTSMCQYACANNSFMIVRDNNIEKLKGDQLYIGRNHISSVNCFNTREKQLLQNDQIFLYSDGFQDQKGESTNKKYFSKKFKDLIFQSSTLGYHQKASFLKDEFSSWKGELAQIDDVSIVGFKYQENKG